MSTRVPVLPVGYADVDPRSAVRTLLGACPAPPPDDPRFALAPLVVVDVRARVARRGSGFRLGPLHLLVWERRHVRIPRGACVVLRGGGPEDAVAPDFTDDAVAWLVARRCCIAVGSDGAAPPPEHAVPGRPLVVRCAADALARVPDVGAWVSLAGPVTVFGADGGASVPGPRSRAQARRDPR